MCKMGMDIDDNRNHRIRGIIPTEDNKYLFIEILQGERPNNKYFNMKPSEYKTKYPNPEYIFIDGCFRVDIPKDYHDNYTKEYKYFHRGCFYNLEYSKENIIKLLHNFNKNINDIELVNDYYLDKYCEEKGFFKLYDSRLKHNYKAIKILKYNDCDIKIKTEYSCKNYDETDFYSEVNDITYNNYDLKELYNIYGKDVLDSLIDNYNENKKSMFSELER